LPGQERYLDEIDSAPATVGEAIKKVRVYYEAEKLLKLVKPGERRESLSGTHWKWRNICQVCDA
jgi:hypothetical protein